MTILGVGAGGAALLALLGVTFVLGSPLLTAWVLSRVNRDRAATQPYGCDHNPAYDCWHRRLRRTSTYRRQPPPAPVDRPALSLASPRDFAASSASTNPGHGGNHPEITWTHVCNDVNVATTRRTQLDTTAVAERLGINPRSVTRYRMPDRTKYGFPAPDGVIGRTPWWYSTTIDKWAAKRPGVGAGAGRPRKASA